MWAYLDGDYLDLAEAKVSITDHSFLYGDGCFEGVGVFGGGILHLDEHVDRLYRSARMLRIPVPVEPDEMRSIVLETASRNNFDTAPMGYLRPLLSRGAGPLGIKWSSEITTSTLAVIPQLSNRRLAYDGEIEVLSAVMSTVTRPSSSVIDPRIKSNNYIPAIMAYLEASDRGADIGIMRDEQGFLSEGHAMNVFCVRDGRVLAPFESVALGGITRKNVIRATHSLGLEFVETNLTAYDAICGDEVFVTSSLEGVAAVSSVDGRPFEQVPGPITTAIREAYVTEARKTATPVPPSQLGTR